MEGCLLVDAQSLFIWNMTQGIYNVFRAFCLNAFPAEQKQDNLGVVWHATRRFISLPHISWCADFEENVSKFLLAWNNRELSFATVLLPDLAWRSTRLIFCQGRFQPHIPVLNRPTLLIYIKDMDMQKPPGAPRLLGGFSFPRKKWEICRGHRKQSIISSSFKRVSAPWGNTGNSLVASRRFMVRIPV